MLQRVIELLRGQRQDQDKAREHLAWLETSSFREAMAEYDAFVPYLNEARGPALDIGTARDSADSKVPVRLPMENIFCHWMIQGGTGTGKTTFATSVFAQAVSRGQRMGIVDCKSGFFDSAIQWAGAIAYPMEPQHRDAFIRNLVIVNPFSDLLVPLVGLHNKGMERGG